MSSRLLNLWVFRTFPAGKQAVCELLAVVGQQLGDPEWTGLVQCLQEGLRTGGRLVGLELHKHPARSPINGHEQIAPAALVLHLGQVLHIHVHIVAPAKFIPTPK